jgi:zeta toxin
MIVASPAHRSPLLDAAWNALAAYPPRPRRERPSIVLVAGGPCSGKDLAIAVLRKVGILPPSDYVLLSGSLFGELPEYRGAAITHPELLPALKPEYRRAMLLLSDEVVRRGYDIVLNTHFDDVAGIGDILRVVHGHGGHSLALAPTTPLETFAYYRRKQEKAKNRFVDVEQALQLHREFSANWPQLIRQVDAHALLDNSVEQIAAEGVPRLCAFGTRSAGTTVIAPAAYARFLDKAAGADGSCAATAECPQRIACETVAAERLHALVDSLCSDAARAMVLAVR